MAEIDRAVMRSEATRRRAVQPVLLAATAALWLLVPQWYVEKAADVSAAWLPAGRFNSVEQARQRRCDFIRFQQDIQRLSDITKQTEIPVPPVTSGYWTYPSLQLGGDPVLGSNYLHTDLLSVAPACRIHLKIVEENAVPVAVRAAIAQVPGLKSLYSSSPR